MKQLIVRTVIIVLGFLLGSVPFSYLVPKIFLSRDIISESRDGNPGASNVFLLCGILPGSICLALDILKGIIPILVGMFFLPRTSIFFALLMTAPVLGHAIGIFTGFRGGKCIATAFGVMIALLPFSRIGLLLATIYIILSGVVRVKPNRKCSIITFSLFLVLSPIILIYKGMLPIACGCVAISAIAIERHIHSGEHFTPSTQIDTVISESDEPEQSRV